MNLAEATELTGQIITRAHELQDQHQAQIDAGENPTLYPETWSGEDDLAGWLRIAARELAPNWDGQVYVPEGADVPTIQLTYYRDPAAI